MRTIHRSREKMFRSALSLTIVSLFFVFTSCTGLFAQTTFNWGPLGGSQGFFSEPDDWSPSSGPPGVGDTARFAFGGPSTVLFNYNPTNAVLQHVSGDTLFQAASGFDAVYTLTGSSTISGGTLTVNSVDGDELYLNFNTLTLSGNSVLFVNAGGVSNVGALNVGNGSAGAINVNGSTASLTSSFTGQNTLGGSTNGQGSLTLSNGATGSMAGSLRIGGGPSTSGNLSVFSGSTFSFGNGNIGNGGTVGQVGTVLVSGVGSTITQTGSSTLNLGKASNGTASITVENGGTYNTGTGLTTVNATGSINVGNASAGGSFNVGGEILVNGGAVNLTHVDSIFSAASLTIDGGQVNRSSGAMSISTVVSTGANLTVGHGTGTGTLTIENSGVLTNSGQVRIGNESSSMGVVAVSGVGSLWNNSGDVFVGVTGSGNLNVESGGVVSNFLGTIGSNTGSTGDVLVSGSGSQWNNSAALHVGDLGQGTLNIHAGGVVSNTFGQVGNLANSTGLATVSGSGSQWNNSHALNVGNSGHGTLNIQAGGTVANTIGRIGNNANSTGMVMVSGNGSQWNNSSQLEIGNSGHGTLSIQAGSVVSSTLGYIGGHLGTGIATVHGSGSQWNNSGFLLVGNAGHGTLSIESGGAVINTLGRIGNSSEAIGVVTVAGSGSLWNNSSSLSVGQYGQGTLNIATGGVVSNSTGRIGDEIGSIGAAYVFNNFSQWNNSSSLTIGNSGFGELTIENGGMVGNTLGYIGFNSTSVGTVDVSGSGSQWNNSSILRVGYSGQGTLNIETAGVVSNTAGYIGYLDNSMGSANVTGIGSQWNNSGFLSVGYLGNGTLNIADGGVVSNSSGWIASEVGSNGVASVSGNGSQWNNAVNLSIGGNDFLAGGQGTLAIGPGGTVTVGETLRIWNNGTLNLYGGTLALDGYGFNAMSGSTINYLSGTVQLAGDRTLGLDNAVAGLFGTVPQISTGRHLHVLGNATLLAPTTINGGTLTVDTLANGGLLNFNTGTLNLTGASGLTVGSGGAMGDVIHVGNQQTYNISHSATVASDGVLSVANGGRFNAQTLNNFGEVIMGGNLARITTSTLTTFNNHGLLSGAGRIDGDFYNHAGGIVELESGKRLTFTDQVSNLAGGRIIGRGQLVAPDINNYGQMLFSGGFTDIQSTITGYEGSQMIITGGGTTSVFGDVEIKGGAELRISDLSNGVFFDHVQLRNGALITGGGNSYFEGSLGIGDSPSRQEFSFNVNLGALSNLIVEIAGTNPLVPEFDQYVFLKDLNLQGGMLTVDLIGLNAGDPAYMPLLGDSFQFIEVAGNWTGSFGTLNLPTLSSGLQWNTSQLYSHGTLSVSAIPEPSSALLLMISLAMFIGRRRVRVGHSRSNLHKTF